MKRKLNASDECSKATATTAGLTFASHSLSSPPADESRCQVAFCEQTAREMTELVNYWQAVESAQKERSPVPSAPVGNSLFAWSDDEDDSTISFDSNLQRKLFSDEEEDEEYQEQVPVKASFAEIIAEPSDSIVREDQASTMAAEISLQTRHLSSELSDESQPSTPSSLDETSSLPSEIHVCSAETSPDWLGSKEEKKIVQNIRAASQQQTQQVNQVTQRTAELEQQVHTTLMNSPLFQRYNRRSPFQKQRQDVLRAIDVALDQQASSPISSSFPRCWQDQCDLWLRYGGHRLEDKLHLGLWEWVPLEWLTIYYYLWAKPSAQTRWTVLFVLGFTLIILWCNLPRSKAATSSLVHFSNKIIFATNYPTKDVYVSEDWLL